MKLTEIIQNHKALEELLFDVDGELTPETETTIDEWLRENNNDLQAKVDAYCIVIRDQQALSIARREEARRIARLAEISENKEARLKERLKLYLQEIGKAKLETPRFKVSVQANGGMKKLLLPDEWTTPANAPERYHSREITLNTGKVREDLSLLASLRKQAQSLIDNCDMEDEENKHQHAALQQDIEELERDLLNASLADTGTHLRIR